MCGAVIRHAGTGSPSDGRTAEPGTSCPMLSLHTSAAPPLPPPPRFSLPCLALPYTRQIRPSLLYSSAAAARTGRRSGSGVRGQGSPPDMFTPPPGVRVFCVIARLSNAGLVGIRGRVGLLRLRRPSAAVAEQAGKHLPNYCQNNKTNSKNQNISFDFFVVVILGLY